MIQEKMLVRFAPEWCTESERHCLMVVLEAWQDVQRCKVMHINSNMSIPPVEVVSFEMIQPAGETV